MLVIDACSDSEADWTSLTSQLYRRHEPNRFVAIWLLTATLGGTTEKVIEPSQDKLWFCPGGLSA
jgi:hypothetical protein